MCGEKHGYVMPGEWVAWIAADGSGGAAQGRVVGRTVDPIDGTVYIVVVALFSSCFVSERWIRPENISYVCAFRPAMLQWLAVDSDEWNKRDKDELRDASARAPWMDSPGMSTLRRTAR